MTGPAPPQAGIRVLIVDDERPARRNLRALLGRYPDATVVGEAGDGESAVRMIQDLRPDVVFLDVQMPAPGGFDVLAALQPREIPIVVFVTGFEEHAIRAFEASALDYLLKPFSDERFELSMERVRSALDHRARSELAERVLGLVESRRPARGPRRLEIRTARGTEYLPMDEIDWIGAEDVYVRVHAGPRSYLVRDRIGDLEQRLDSDRFVRIHRSSIVNLDRVRGLERDDLGGENAVLRDGSKLRVSRSRREALRAALEGS